MTESFLPSVQPPEHDRGGGRASSCRLFGFERAGDSATLRATATSSLRQPALKCLGGFRFAAPDAVCEPRHAAYRVDEKSDHDGLFCQRKPGPTACRFSCKGN